MRLYQQRLWVYLMAALLPLVVFSVVMVWVFNNQQRDALETMMREAATSASFAVDGQVDATVAVLYALAASSAFEQDDWPTFAQQVAPVVAGAGWLTLAVTDDQRQLFNLRGIGPIVDRVGMTEALASGEPAVSDLVPPGGSITEPAVVIRIPILRPGRPPRTLAAFLPSRAFNRLLHEHIPDTWINAVADRNGIIIARSDSPDAFIGTPLAPAFLAAWRDDTSGVFEGATKEGEPSYGRVGPAGATGWSLAMAAPKEAVDGPYRVVRYMLWLGGTAAALLTLLLTGTFLQVVARGREAERARAAADAERRLAFALESANAATWDWDMVDDCILWSEEFYRLHGFPPAMPPSRQAWIGHLHPAERDRAAAAIAEVLASRATEFRLEFRILHRERGLRWILSQGRPVFADDGTPLRMSGVDIDMTERKAMEAAVQAALAEAQKANMAKSKFLAAASHDIRQPIQSLMLFAHALANKLKGHPAAPLVDKVSVALNALKLLLDSILDISKLDAGLVMPERSTFAVADVLSRLAAEYQPRMAAKGLSFRAVASSAWVETDPTLLGRIVGNLLENALKYTEDGRVVLGCRRHGGQLAIVVADTGVGIPPEDHEAIFEEFVQIGSHGRDRAQGMGLGLATVKRLAALLGLGVGVQSRPGCGSRFWVEVPLVEAVCAIGGDIRLEDRAVGGRRILVVDDEAAILEGMRVILESAGHDVAVARSPDEAVERVRNGFEPDIVVTDYRLPFGHNGSEVIHRVRDVCNRTIPCVVLTGDTEIVAAGLPSTALMHKPVDAGELEQTIGRLCRAA